MGNEAGGSRTGGQRLTSQNSQAAAPPKVLRATQFVVVVLRVGIGWHFLYEGLIKLFDRQWTATGYLLASSGPLAGLFHRWAAEPAIMRVVDWLNIWGLILIGAGLMLGLFTRLSALAGVLLLGLYYLADPPLFGAGPAAAAEGHYLIVSKNLIELLSLLVVLSVPVRNLGLDGLLAHRRADRRSKRSPAADGARDLPPSSVSRRWMLSRLVGLPFMGGFVVAWLKKRGWPSHEENQLSARADARTGATIKVFDFSKRLEDLKGRLPAGMIGNLKVSRMILGGNLIGGWAHARDLIYVSKLIKAYHHRDKVFETFRLAEACGINTFITNPVLCDTINDYWKTIGGKMQFISDCGGGDLFDMAKASIDRGACACYVHGGMADRLVDKGNLDVFGKFLDLVRENGLPAGIAGHHFRTVEACAREGLRPDFWMKTLHHHNYWSALGGKDQCDNLWCDDPEKTVEFMLDRREPWIAYKILAAGAIQPQDGFKYAFTHGADFICVGMYDFQIIEDVNIALDVLNGKLERRRDWLA